MNPRMDFDAWFEKATENAPYPYQRRFATETSLPQLVDVPTGMGKTAMVVLGWVKVGDKSLFKVQWIPV